MTDDLGVFERIGLTGRRTIAVPLPDDGFALVAEIHPEEYLEAWNAARAHVEDFGRWPVVRTVQRWEDLATGLVFSRRAFASSQPGLNSSVAAVIERAQSMDLDKVLAEILEVDSSKGHALVDRQHLDELLAMSLRTVHDRWGTAPAEPDLRRVATSAADPALAIERCLLDWERSQGEPPTEADGAVAAAKSYLEPLAPEPPPGDQTYSVALVLLPTLWPWEVYAYLEGLWSEPADRLVAAARRWHARFGAEPVQSHPGYATHLRVERPPTDLEEAWRLAREHYLIAWDTFALPGSAVRDYARALLESSTWYLISKP